jgi:hypothetical protein
MQTNRASGEFTTSCPSQLLEQFRVYSQVQGKDILVFLNDDTFELSNEAISPPSF